MTTPSEEQLALEEARRLLAGPPREFSLQTGFHAAGERIGFSIFARQDGESAVRIEAVWLAFGHLEVDWSPLRLIVKDPSGVEEALSFSPRGHARRRMPRSEGTTTWSIVLPAEPISIWHRRPVRVAMKQQPLPINLTAAASTGPSEIVLEAFRAEFRSGDGRLKATVEGTGGSFVSVLIETEVAELEGALARFCFRTSVGHVFEHEVRLRRDEENERCYFGAWQGSLSQPTAPPEREANKSSGEPVSVTFEFELSE